MLLARCDQLVQQHVYDDVTDDVRLGWLVYQARTRLGAQMRRRLDRVKVEQVHLPSCGLNERGRRTQERQSELFDHGIDLGRPRSSALLEPDVNLLREEAEQGTARLDHVPQHRHHKVLVQGALETAAREQWAHDERHGTPLYQRSAHGRMARHNHERTRQTQVHAERQTRRVRQCMQDILRHLGTHVQKERLAFLGVARQGQHALRYFARTQHTTEGQERRRQPGRLRCIGRGGSLAKTT